VGAARELRASGADGEAAVLAKIAQVQNEILTIGFTDAANLDDGAMWPVAFAIKELTSVEEARIAALVRAAVATKPPGADRPGS